MGDIDGFSARRRRRRSQRKATRTVDVFGRTWTLPAQMPAAFVLMAAQMTAGHDRRDDLTYGQSLELAQALLPPDVLAAWLDLGVSEAELWWGVVAVITEYRGKPAPALRTNAVV